MGGRTHFLVRQNVDTGCKATADVEWYPVYWLVPQGGLQPLPGCHRRPTQLSTLIPQETNHRSSIGSSNRLATRHHRQK